jgi:type IV secretory pathway VirB10-like protein
MNPKILLAFAGGAAAAGALAFFLTKGSDSRPAVDPAPSTTAQIVERPVNSESGRAADVAATLEPVRPRPVESARNEMKLPKPAPVEVKKSRVGEPIQSAPEPAPVQTAANDANSGSVILPPFNSTPAAPSPTKEEPRRAEIFKPDTVAKPPAPRTPETVTIPAGTSISVRLNSTINSEKNVAGDTFTATLESPITINDIVLADRGARVEGRVVEVDRSGRVKGVARLTLALTRIQLTDGQRVEIKTDPWERIAESSKKSDAAKVGIGAALGAAIGAIAGGGKGAAVGAASGAGAGTGVVLATRGKAAQIDVETKIPFRLAAPLTVTEKIN